MELGVYVPYEGTITTIKPGSAICGQAESEWSGRSLADAINETMRGDDRVMLYYEGNLFGSMPDWATMLFHAADRLIARYPTVARCSVKPDDWYLVGSYYPDTERLYVEDQAALDAWIANGTHAPHPTKTGLLDLLKEFRPC